MSLKARLFVSILAVVFTVVVALSALNLNHAISESFEDVDERAQLIAQQVRTFVQEIIHERTADLSLDQKSSEEIKRTWSALVRNDPRLSRALETTVRNSSFVIDIAVVNDDNLVLASSGPAGLDAQPANQPAFTEWQPKTVLERLRDLVTSEHHYVVTLPLLFTDRNDPSLAVKIFVSSVLLRQEILPQVQWLVAVSASFLAISVLLGLLVAQLAGQSVEQISRNIERISTGQVDAVRDGFESKELAALDRKLNQLGDRFRLFRDDALELRSNLDQMLEQLEETVLLFGPDGCLRMAGRPAERLLAKSRADLIGQPMEQVFPAWTELGTAIQKAIRDRKPLRDQPVTLQRSNMPPARLVLNVELLDHSTEKQVSTLVTLRDADSRRELQSHFDTATRLAAISRITSGLAHEIKNPLNAIALHLEAAKAKLQAGPGGDVGSEMEIIAKEVSRLDRVVKTFLDFNKPLELKMSECDLAELTREIADLLRPQAKSRDIEIQLESLIDKPIVSGDRDLLKEAILNVVLNGIEAMNKTGKLLLQVHPAFDNYVLSVTDEGQGIAPAIQDKIYNLYFTTKESASGIGLAVTFRVMQIHNGTIKFDSKVGKGTTFRLDLPALLKAS